MKRKNYLEKSCYMYYTFILFYVWGSFMYSTLICKKHFIRNFSLTFWGDVPLQNVTCQTMAFVVDSLFVYIYLQVFLMKVVNHLKHLDMKYNNYLNKLRSVCNTQIFLLFPNCCCWNYLYVFHTISHLIRNSKTY